jgi:hypothetical protein
MRGGKNTDDKVSTDKESTTINANNNKEFESANCAPKAGKEPSFTCYTPDALTKIKNLWNARHPDEPITSTDPKTIWAALKENMQYVCHNETCWLRQQFAQGLDKELLNETFAPFAPKSWKRNPNEWLSSIEIENVMKQYEQAYTCFDFMGPSPIDFDKHYVNGDCVWEELCEFSLKKKLQQGKRKLGVIFNTDPHTKGGSHWIALFVDFKKGFIFYFDSTGRPAPAEVRTFVERIIEQAIELPAEFGGSKKLEFIENTKVPHQQGNTECGMYALYMIICLLTEPTEGRHKTYEDFIDPSKKIQDKEMEQLRHKLFNQEGGHKS